MSAREVLRPIDPHAPELRRALEDADLPTDDLGEAGRRFYALDEGIETFGYIGCEGEGADRLLRSLVVAPDARGRGAGSRLVDALEARLRGEGCERLHILTTTAEDFFARRGYVRVDRDSAPSAIAATREFADLCPASAAYMVKPLG